MKNTSMIDTIKLFFHTFMRLHVVVFIVFVVGGLIAAILILNSVLITPQTTTPTSSDTNQDSGYTTMFDQTTINQLSSLELSANNSSYLNSQNNERGPFSE